MAVACLAVVAATAGGCGAPQSARPPAAERLPANGASGAPGSALRTTTVTRQDWNRAVAERLKPTCDAHEGVRTADTGNLQGAGKILGDWTSLHGQKSKSGTADGKTIGRSGPEPTRDVESVGMTCAAGTSMVQINGTQYPFDLAWVVAGKGKGKTLDGTEGAGQFVMILALSYKDRRVVFAKVYVPGDANDDTDDTMIVTSLADYLPEDPDAPVVHVVGEREAPELEAFVPSKGGSEGLSFRVAEEDALGRARYLSATKFKLAP